MRTHLRSIIFYINSTVKGKIVIKNYNIKNPFNCVVFLNNKCNLIYRDVCLKSYIFKFFGKIFVVYSSLLILRMSLFLCTKLVVLCNKMCIILMIIVNTFYMHIFIVMKITVLLLYNYIFFTHLSKNLERRS